MKRAVMAVLGMGIIVGCSQVTRNELEGKWQSNKEKTLEYINSSGVLTEQQRKFLEPQYGKLIFDVRSNDVTVSWIDGSSPTQTYSYTYTRDGDKYTINVAGQTNVYTMEGDCMWINLDRNVKGLREYFCRVK